MKMIEKEMTTFPECPKYFGLTQVSAFDAICRLVTDDGRLVAINSNFLPLNAYVYHETNIGFVAAAIVAAF
jgi:hypothetical protein